jgi:hypothetical protein
MGEWDGTTYERHFIWKWKEGLLMMTIALLSSCYLFYVQNVLSAGEVVAPVNFATVEPHELHQWRSAALDKWTFIDISKL